MRLTARLLLILLGSSSTAKAVDYPPLKTCYTEPEVQALADGILELKRCRFDLMEREDLINEKLTKYDATPAFWQEPSFVWGGIVVSASVASLVTWYVARRD